MTVPIFILSSGRSGSQMMEKLLSSHKNAEVHHEYLCNIIQPLGTEYYMNQNNLSDLNEVIDSTFGSAISLTTKDLWIDSSNKLSWIVGPLSIKFPNAKFVHLIRDGRRVVSSYYNKLYSECYDDFSVKCLYDFFYKAGLQPPPEKKFWWPLIKHKGSYENFMNLNQFQKICLHWSEINKVIEEGIKNVNPYNTFFLRLEDLIQNKETYENFMSFLGLQSSEENFHILKKPHNVNLPKSFELNEIQLRDFDEICGATMKKYGYDHKNDYEVKY